MAIESEYEAFLKAWTEDPVGAKPVLVRYRELLSALPGSDFRLDRDARERVLHYLLYRQLERIEDYGPARFLRYGLVCTDFIDLLALQMRDPAEALRRWSEQIEYSTENVDIIMEGVESCFER